MSPGDDSVETPPSSDVSLPDSQQARARAALVLEVLAGERTATEAAEELGVTMTSYYKLEDRAVNGMVEALKKVPRGPRRNFDKEIEKLERECRRLERECRRNQSLLRVSQKAVGLSVEREEKTGRAGKKRRKRNTQARGSRQAKVLRRSVEAGAGEKSVASTDPPSDNARET